MAKLIGGIGGPFIGKVGTVIGSTWKGIPYIKAKSSKKKKKKNKPKKNEQANQTRFATVHYWLQPLLDFVRVGFKGYSETVEGYNAAKSYVLKNAVKEENGKYIIDPALVQVSYGTLPLPTELSASRVENDTLILEWDSNGGNPYDQVMILAYDPETRDADFLATGEFRKEGKCSYKVPPGYHIYVAFNGHDRESRSHSVYLGVV